MCGIIGIYGDKEVASELWFGLIGLQHRGQDTAGIITYKDGRFYLKKGSGTVQNFFTSEDLKRLKGKVGLGHVRYPTIGAGDPEDAQPFYTNAPFGIAMAHNGNVINYQELKEWLVRERRRHINTSNDVEIILNLLASELGQARQSSLLQNEVSTVFEAVRRLMGKVNGSYSCVCFIAGEGLLAFRDPHGIKPLKFGWKGKNFCFASESVALDTLGYREMRDVEPGEAVFITVDRKVSSKVIKKLAPRHCIFEYIYFARPDSIIDGIWVYEARFRLGEELARRVQSRRIKPDVVIPVPDTARTTALSMAQSLGVPYREGLIKNRYIGRTFIMPRDRRKIVQYKLNPVRCEIEGKRVLLVDDSIVRGSTSRAIVSLVREAGPRAVYFASSSSPLKYPCFYGIDMQTRQEFIAREKSVNEIQKEIGADELIYQSIEGMLRAVKTLSPHRAASSQRSLYCSACFDGDYPTKINPEEIARIEKDRG